MNDVEAELGETIESTKRSSRQTGEIDEYHKGKRIIISLTDMEKETQMNFRYVSLKVRILS